MSTIPFDHQTNSFIHQVLLTVAWAALINTSLIAIQFKSKKISFLVHFILGVSVIILTLLGPLLFLIEHGIKLEHNLWYKQAHNIIGFITFCVIPLQGILGYIIRRSQQKQFLSMNNTNKLKLIHKIFGLTLIIFAKIAYLIRYLNHWQFIPLLVFQGVTFLTLIFIRIRQKKLILKKQQFFQNIIKTVSNLKQLQDFPQFFIIANKIYSILSVKNFHPGGVSIINLMKGRQIDRFLFGCAGPQTSPHLKFQHPKQTLKILKYPIAQLTLQRPYLNMKYISSCKVVSSSLLNNGQTFLIKLTLKNNQENVFFRGYSKFQQFGYYHSLSLNEQVTRLYTGVNSLRAQNIQRIQQILNLMKISCDFKLKQQISVQVQLDYKNKQKNALKCEDNLLNNTLLSCQSLSESDSAKNEFYIPLLIKKYQNGKFTSKLFYKNNKKSYKKLLNLQLSQPLGKGLGLEQLQFGKVIFLVGGTGLFPFIDLIDILFKLDIKKRGFYGSQCLQNFDPILNNKSKAQKLEYVLILALRHLSDIHPFTLFQINHLCGKQSTINFVCKLKSSKDQAMLRNKICNSVQCSNVISETMSQAKSDNCQRIYICGPPSLQKQIISQLNEDSRLKNLYQIV